MNNTTEFVVGSFSNEPIDIHALAETGTTNPTDWFVNLLGGNISDSGQRVDGKLNDRLGERSGEERLSSAGARPGKEYFPGLVEFVRPDRGSGARATSDR